MKAKRALSAFLTAAMMVPLLLGFTQSSFGAEAKLYEDRQLYTEITQALPSSVGRETVEDYGDSDFSLDSDSYYIKYSRFHATDGIFLFKNEDGALPVTVSKTFSEPLDLSKYNELFFQNFIGTAESVEPMKIKVTLYSGQTAFSASCSVVCGESYDVYFPLTDFKERGSITGISFTFESTSIPERISVSTIFADSNYTYSYKNRFSAENIESETDLRQSDDALYLTVSESGAKMTALTDKKLADTGTVLVRCVISNADAGNLTLSVKSKNASEYTDISTLTLFPGENSYTFMYNASKGTYGYALTFSGVNVTSGDEIVMESISFSHYAESLSDVSDTNLGSISACNLTSNGDKVRISGILQSSAVISNIGAALGVYAVDMWGNNKTDILSSIAISTAFEMTVDITDIGIDPYFCLFYVAVINESGITPISNPVYPSIPSSSRNSGKTVLGIQSSDSSVPFRANVGQTVVDVDLDLLYSPDNTSGRTHTYSGKYYYLDNSYVKELDSQIKFLINSGINVLLRIISKSPQNGADGYYAYTFDASDYDSAIRYAAMIDFLTSRYTEIAGVIVGSRIDCLLYNYGAFGDIISYCRNYVDILRITSAIVRTNTQSAIVAVPFGDGYVYDGDDRTDYDFSYNSTSGVGTKAADPMLVSEIISKLIAKNGAFQWYIMYECENDPLNAVSFAYKMFTQCSQGNGTTPSGHIVLWQPESTLSPYETAETLQEIADAAATLGTRAVILSLTHSKTDETELCNRIRNMSFEETSLRQNHIYTASPLTDTQEGALTLWDFRSSFSTGGFIYGGTVTSLTTESISNTSDDENNCRALHGKTSSELGSCAIVLSYFDTPKNFSVADSVYITLCINSEGENDYPVKIILGKDNIRHEYSASITSGSPVTLKCDIDNGAYTSSISFFAVSVISDEDISFDISQISASSSLSDEEFKSIFNESTDDDNDEIYKSKYVIIGIVFTAITFIGLALSSQKSISEGKKSIAQNRTPSKNLQLRK